MNNTLAHYRIASGWPELLSAGFPTVPALEMQSEFHDMEVQDAKENGHESGHVEGYEEAEKEYKADALRAPELEEERDKLQDRLDALQEQLDELLDGDSGAIMRAKLDALQAECLDICDQFAPRLTVQRKQTGRRQFMREMRERILLAFAAARPKVRA